MRWLARPRVVRVWGEDKTCLTIGGLKGLCGTDPPSEDPPSPWLGGTEGQTLTLCRLSGLAWLILGSEGRWAEGLAWLGTEGLGTEGHDRYATRVSDPGSGSGR